MKAERSGLAKLARLLTVAGAAQVRLVRLGYPLLLPVEPQHRNLAASTNDTDSSPDMISPGRKHQERSIIPSTFQVPGLRFGVGLNGKPVRDLSHVVILSSHNASAAPATVSEEFATSQPLGEFTWEGVKNFQRIGF